jgi:hypothetical protein
MKPRNHSPGFHDTSWLFREETDLYERVCLLFGIGLQIGEIKRNRAAHDANGVDRVEMLLHGLCEVFFRWIRLAVAGSERHDKCENRASSRYIRRSMH